MRREYNITFKELQDATIAGAFDESDRANVKRWINFRAAWIWDIADWTFAQGTASVTVTAGAVTNEPADFVSALAMFQSDGTPLVAMPQYRDFSEAYIGTSAPGSILAEAFTVLGSSILVGPTGSSGTYTLVYQKGPTELDADGDVPAIPAGYHLALVHGAKAEGFRLTNVPLAAQFDADFQAAITAMSSRYLSNTDIPVQTPAYIP